jgi:HAD superfamily hydrolase (TIGR01549 family)
VSVRRALVFDFDGLIVDSETVHANGVIELLAEDGVACTLEDIAHLYGGTGGEIDRGWDELVQVWGNTPDFTTFESRLWERIDPRLAELEVRPGVTRLLAEARAHGWATVLATGRQPTRLDIALDRHDLREAFDVIVTSSEVANGKPEPDIFLAAAERAGVEPSACVVLEDSLPGARAALAAGMKVVVCPCELTQRLDFPPGAELVTSLDELDLAAL